MSISDQKQQQIDQKDASRTAQKQIAVVGLGYVGLPLAAEFGRRRPVLGFDINENRIADLRAGRDATLELTQAELKQAKFLRFSHDVDDLRDCKIYIVTVPTPTDHANQPDFRPLISASSTVGQVIKAGDIVIYESTVFPGATEEICVPVLEKVSGLTFNRDFFCGYSPERINPGDKVNRLPTIKKITSGSTPEVAREVDALYQEIVTAGTHLAPSLKVAEAAKVIENTQRDLNIALMNELAVLCHRLDIDTLEVLEAAGTKWNFLPFRPGLVGGHCISVDPYYLTYKAEQVGYHPQVILAGRRINDNMGRYAARKTIQLMLANGIDVPRARIGILGVTFKENCPDIRNSKVVDVVRELKRWGAPVAVSDPWANANELRHEYGLELEHIDADNPVDALIVAVGHQEYRALSSEQLRALTRGEKPVLSDLKSLYNRQSLQALGLTVFRL
jgi:UDP-N-acetyl-D-glucosamine/UDP-N-acetyl-D-galactosamine dehydrogenase